MTKQHKKRLYNGLMVAAAVLIVLVSVMAVGHVRGWFGKQTVTVQEESGEEEISVTVRQKSGNVHLTRSGNASSGIAYSLSEGSALREGDVLETEDGASVEVHFGKSVLYLEENSRLSLSVTEAGELLFTLEKGSLMADLSDRCLLDVNGTRLAAQDAVFAASAPQGSGSVSVLAGSVTSGNATIEEGEAASLLSSGVNTEPLSLTLLSDSQLSLLTTIGRTLCVSTSEVEAEVSRREAIRKAELTDKLEDESSNASGEKDSASSAPSGDRSEVSTSSGEAESEDSSAAQTSGQSGAGGESSNGSTSGANSAGAGGGNTSGGGSSGSSGSGSGGSPGESSQSTPSESSESGGVESSAEPAVYTCTIEIRCDTILNQLGNLKEGKESCVPQSGVILPATQVTFTEGESVFDVLERVCSAAGIPLEYTWNGVFGTNYIEGINNLYEFDCGGQSGWIYRVNGYQPGTGCSGYTVEDGDYILWAFSCSGYGADVP